MVTKDGNEHNTVQFSEDGINFKIASITELMQIAGGPFVQDAFTIKKMEGELSYRKKIMS